MDSPKLADLGIQAMTSPIHLRIQHANIYAIDKACKIEHKFPVTCLVIFGNESRAI
jgi:hypothetical protein